MARLTVWLGVCRHATRFGRNAARAERVRHHSIAHSRPRHAFAARGVTLIDMVLVLAIAAVILGGAIAFGSQWIGHAKTSTTAMTAVMQRDALRTAARSWFTGRYCQPDRRAGVVETPPPDLELSVEELRGHLQEGVLPMETAEPAMNWRIRITRTGLAPPLLHALWRPTRSDMREALARQTGALCDADDDPATEEPCTNGSSTPIQLAWSELLAQPTSRLSRARRLSDWTRLHGIMCDTTGPDLDGDGVGDPDGFLDRRCDVNGDGRFGPYLVGGRNYTGHYDADADGLLDLDIAGGPTGTGDLAVDVHDWHALGC